MHQVRSSKDLLDLRDAYRDAIAAGDASFEVHVAAGTYDPATWEIAPDPKQPAPAIDLVLRGEGSAVPRPARLGGASVRVEGMVFTGSVTSTPVEIEATRRIVLSNAAIIDGRAVDPQSRAPYLLLRARGAVTLFVEGCWFVRNWQGKSPAALVALAAHPFAGGRFDEAVICDSVFLGNCFATELAISDTYQARIERSLFYKTWPSGSFITGRATAKIDVTDTVLVAEDLDAIGQVSDGCPPLAFGAGTRVYARSYTAATPIPSGLAVDRAALHDRSPIDGGAKFVEDNIQMKAELPAATLRSDLVTALT